MSADLNGELAFAARRLKALNERIPEAHRINLAPDWQALLAEVEAKPRSRALVLVAEWREQQEQRLSIRLLNAPLEETHNAR